MKYIITTLLLLAGAGGALPGQSLAFRAPAPTDTLTLTRVMPALAQQAIARYAAGNREQYLYDLLRLQVVSADYTGAVASIQALRMLKGLGNTPFPTLEQTPFAWYAEACTAEPSTRRSFRDTFSAIFTSRYTALDDKAAVHIAPTLTTRSGVTALYNAFSNTLAPYTGHDSIPLADAVLLCKQYAAYEVYRRIEPLTTPLLRADDERRFTIDTQVLIPTSDGAQLTALVVRRKQAVREPAALLFTIYAESNNLNKARWAAACGYAGVVAYTRGKAFSHDVATPYEREATDVNAAIEWITRQPWSDGRVGMYGGSYEGFSQWAATKHLHPALKTIVPYVAAIPGQGVPMENNVFINANYAWPFYVTNTKYLDDKTYDDHARWRALPWRWYESGVAFNRIDSIDGTPNPWLQRWLQHPAFDAYWQSMVPYRHDFANIHIPVLSVTGYYDDGQISALQYVKDHYQYNPYAEHYLIIGPYDHFGAQRGGMPVLRDYVVDAVSLIDTREITFQWLDYILKGGDRPGILKDKINYQVMGSNTWKHAPSLQATGSRHLDFYLTDNKHGHYFSLSPHRPRKPGAIVQTVDLADHRTSNNNSYYPYPIVRDSLDVSDGLFFVSAPLDHDVTVAGCFEGKLRARINKRDMDVGVVLYEIMPDGRFFHLSYFLGRASYARDHSRRQLLRPGHIETIPFNRTRMVSRQLKKGSRLLVVLNINKNAFAQVNYGTGKDVSMETIRDAGAPLEIQWYTNSMVRIPVDQ